LLNRRKNKGHLTKNNSRPGSKSWLLWRRHSRKPCGFAVRGKLAELETFIDACNDTSRPSDHHKRGRSLRDTLPDTSDEAGKADWAERFKRRPPIPANRILSKAETQAFYDEMKGAL
jgi:hypothetical protein